MNRAEFLFKLIDIFGKPLQNTVRIKDIRRTEDVSYGENPACKLDLYYRDDGIKDKPIIVYFHGGGFLKGGKKYRRSISELLADRGFFVVNADYRLAPEYPFPACVEDAVAVLNFLPSLREIYSINVDKVVVCGDSSGGYLSAYCVACCVSSKLRKRLSLPDVSVKLAGFIGFCGVYDVLEMIRMKEPSGIAKKTGECFLGIKFGRKFAKLTEYEYLDCISPLELIDENFVKSLIIYSDHDILCPKQGQKLIEALKEKGIENSEYHAPKLFDNHCFHFHFWRKAAKDAMEKAYVFLDEIVKEN